MSHSVEQYNGHYHSSQFEFETVLVPLVGFIFKYKLKDFRLKFSASQKDKKTPWSPARFSNL